MTELPGAAAPNKLLIMAGGMTAMFLAALSQTIIATALPRIVADLHGLSHLSWVFTAYMLASTIAVPVAGKLSDIFGRRVVYLVAIAVFVGASVLAGFSQNMLALILFRGLQGLGGGALMVNTMAVIGDLFPPAERGRWQGLFGGVFGLASIVGPLLGGWITDSFTWRWIFFLNVPIGMIAVAVIVMTFPRQLHKGARRSIDYAGAVLLSAGLVPLLLALVWGGNEYAWASPTILGMLAVGVVALGLFAVVERRAEEPILPLHLFSNRTFAVSAIVTFLSSLGMFGTLLFLPVFAQGVVGFSATSSGLVMTPMMLGLVIASAATGQIVSRTGRYRALLVAGGAVATFGMFLFSRVSPQTGSVELVTDMFVTGFGLGMTMPILSVTVQNAFEHSKLGVVTAASQMFRTVGGTVGGALFGGLMNTRLASGLSNVRADPFVERVLEMGGPATAFADIDADKIQGILSPQGQAAVNGLIARAPEAVQAALAPLYQHFLGAVQMAFSDAIAYIFFAGMLAMAVGAVISLWLPHVELRRTQGPALEEAGRELDAELAILDPGREPDLTDPAAGPARPSRDGTAAQP